ncbi:hypothetical protein MAA_01633 [Metarhizium robertsii ARSEF 23]|uniref:CENP-V/GFA domain-containing protein n=1 Tax=Metarhizium robertsii (strain ARSEF 23 / ATCC MYA-3075) TaxID=655844 RepID=E9ENN4_METRA|nr:uncharacterized protein MAA_01633 [Metarhizium robertsii ARSEF 23]EFZ02051.1 hypothetical protein MAA_01633 [Metarhizium robertsii ARSEF 23]
METTCLCKAVTVKVSQNWLDGKQHGQICHCYNCRKPWELPILLLTAPRLQFLVNCTSLKITTPRLASQFTAISVKSAAKFELIDCHYSPIKSESHLVPDSIILKMGIFEHVPKPKSEGFAQERQAWGQPVAPDVEQLQGTSYD